MNIEALFEYYNWGVVGDVTNESKYANKILNTLKREKYNVVGIDPRGDGEAAFIDLKSSNFNIDVIDLCVNPKLGLEILKEARQLNIDKVLIQPGAESDEIVEFCKENNIKFVKGCVLKQLS